MKRLATFAFLSVSAIAISTGSAFADYKLNILHINDWHSRIESINKYDSTCSAEDETKGACFGGAARLVTEIAEQRKAAEGQNLLVLDAGDNFQGSLFFTTYKGDAEAEFLSLMGFDAMTVGNHEFDNGEEGLAGFLDKVKFPVLGANIVAGPASKLGDRVKPYVILDVGGQKIGIVGTIDNDAAEISSPGPNVQIIDDVTAITGAVSEIEKQGVNKIIALSHAGYPHDISAIARIPGVDVIVGGHSHTFLSNTDPKAEGTYPTWVDNPAGYKVPVVQAASYSKYLGDIAVTFDDDGKVIEAKGDPILLDASVKPDEAVAARIAELAKPIEELKAKVIGESAAPIDGDRKSCRARECEMGDLVSDAMLDRTRGQGISIAIQNGGGLRASIDAGPVTMGEVLTVLPFQNTLSTFQLKGEDVVAALENGVSQIEEEAGRFPQVAGLHYTFDASKPAGSRISNVEVQDGDTWKPIDLAATYGVVSNNFMRAGGDGYTVFKDKGMNAYDYGPNLEEVLAAYIAGHTPFQPKTDGRITAVEAAAPAPEAAPAPAPAPAPTEVKMPELPAATTTLTTEAPSLFPQTHVIEAGDNYWNLARKYYGDPAKWKKIEEANPAYHARGLPVGMPLTVPAP